MARKIAVPIALLFGVLLWGKAWLNRSSVESAVPPLGQTADQTEDQTENFRSKSAMVGKQIPKMAKNGADIERQWVGLRSQVAHLGSEEQSRLDELYARAKSLIQADEQAVLKEVLSNMSAIVAGSLEESFFTFSSFLRNAKNPADMLFALWDYTPRVDPTPVPMPNGISNSAEADAHHVVLTEALKYEHINAYALRELRKRVMDSGVSFDSGKTDQLISELSRRAASATSLNLSLELFALLKSLGATDQIETALLQHSERDRNIIKMSI